jgi:hypothetical protein
VTEYHSRKIIHEGMFCVKHYGYLFEQTITRQTCLIGQQCQVNVHVYRLLELKNRGKQKLCSVLDVEIGGTRSESRASGN